MNNKAIGVFDSGIGGLTVYKAIKEKMPNEKVVYLGDTARLPYGSKSKKTIIKYSIQNAEFLIEQDVKIIVIACNSSSSYAVETLQTQFDIPVVGVIEPGAEAAIKYSKKKIGVIGTTATICSGAYKTTILDKSDKFDIISKDCPLFVPLVEEGWINHPVTRLVIKEYLDPLVKQNIETLVLGCTHYPVLKEVIKEVIGDEIKLVDSAETTAQRVYNIFESLGWLSGNKEKVIDEFFVTDFPDRFKRVGEIFLKKKIEQVKIADIKTIGRNYAVDN